MWEPETAGEGLYHLPRALQRSRELVWDAGKWSFAVFRFKKVYCYQR